MVAGPEIGELLGVSRQRVHQLQATPAFPAPLVQLRTGPVWDRRAVEAYARSPARQPNATTTTVAPTVSGRYTGSVVQTACSPASHHLRTGRGDQPAPRVSSCSTARRIQLDTERSSRAAR